MRRVAEGSRWAFERLIRRHQARLRAHCARICGAGAGDDDARRILVLVGTDVAACAAIAVAVGGPWRAALVEVVRDVQPIFNTLEQFKVDVGCGILLLHHTRKDGGVYRGSSAIEGSLDNNYLLTNDNGRLTLKAEKTRDSLKPEPKHYRIVQYQTRSHPDTGEPVYAPALLPASQVIDAPDATPQRVAGNQRLVLEALDAFDEGLTMKVLEDITDISSSVLYRTVADLQEQGYVAKQGNAQRSAVMGITAQGREALA